MAQYSYGALASSYGQFKAPSARVKLGEQDVVKNLGCRLQSVSVKLSRQEPCEADIEIWDCYNMEAHSIDSGLKSNISPGEKIEVELGYQSSLKKIFSGYIAAVTLDMTVQDACIIHIQAKDVIALLRENTRCRIFKGSRISAVFSELMEDYSWICQASASSTPKLDKEGAWWQRGSDYDFIVKELVGLHNPDYEFYVEAGTAYLKKKEEAAAAVSLKPGNGIEDFHITWNYLYKKIRVQGISENHETYLGESEAGGPQKSQKAKPGMEFHVMPQADTKDKADALASAIADEQAGGAVDLSVTIVGIPELSPGKGLELEGFDSWVNGVYLILEAEHVMDQEGYKSRVRLGGN